MARTGLLAFLLLAGATVVARAGSISISITPTVEFANDKLTVKVKVSNTGDEAAQSILPHLKFRDGEAKGTLKEQLGPNETVEQTLEVPAAGLGPGRYPFRLAVDYTDLNQYPFQALQVSTVTVGSAAPPKMAVTLAADQLATTGKATVTIRNLVTDARNVNVTVHASDGIEIADQPGAVTLAGFATETATARLVNRTALAGSRYPIFAAVEFDADGAHQTMIGQGAIEIVPARSFVEENRSTLYVGAGALFAVWVGAVVWWMLGRRAAVPNA